MEMVTIPEFPPVIVRYACQAFTISCEQHGVLVPMSEVAPQIVVDVDGPNLQLLWAPGLPVMLLAEGRFYPHDSGGKMRLCFLRTKHGTNVRLNPKQLDVYVGYKYELPHLMAPALIA